MWKTAPETFIQIQHFHGIGINPNAVMRLLLRLFLLLLLQLMLYSEANSLPTPLLSPHSPIQSTKKPFQFK
ncbi:hypothetical protein ACLKA7_012090 [Drosophila subpalustris]